MTAVLSDVGGVLTSQPVSVLSACAEESGIPVEDLERAMHAATEVADGRQPLFELEKGAISETSSYAAWGSSWATADRCPTSATPTSSA